MSPITVNGPHQSGSATPAAGSISGAADKSSASTQTFTGNVEAPAFIADGLTGSVAASRYVGATATGAPASGAHLLGDYVITQDGHVFICTVAGTPGTWRDVNLATTAADLASASAQTFTGNVGTPAVVVSGLTGGTAASRYVGANASGPPTTGAHLLGDVAVDQLGFTWVCTIAGTPGTWRPTASEGYRRYIELNAQGFKGENFNLRAANVNSAPVTSRMYYTALPLIAGEVVTNLYVYVQTVSTSLTLSRFGIYGPTTVGALRASCADLTTYFNTTTGLKTAALSTPYTVPTTGLYYVGQVHVGTTGPSEIAATLNMGLYTAGPGGGGQLMGTQTTQTDLPDPGVMTPGSSAFQFWIGWA